VNPPSENVLGPSPADDASQTASFVQSRSLKRDLLDELRTSWDNGTPVAPEELLRRWPGDPSADPDVASLLFEDYQRRSRKGESAPSKDYEERFPNHQDSLASLIRHHEVLRSLGASEPSVPRLTLPGLGDQLFGFCLHHELGQGAFARVFLAEQADLANRPVVVKVSGIEGTEPQTLAQLQHTHIVPIYSVHEDAHSGLRAVCMPYFGGASLSRVLQRLWDTSPRPTCGEELVQALESVAAPVVARAGAGERESQEEKEAEGEEAPRSPSRLLASPTPALPRCRAGAPTTMEGDQTPRDFLRRTTYVRAAAWIVARLAEGLEHAHQRGVLHRDIKPSNVLLGADGQPMLLDFNLAHDAHNAPAHATLGGTVAYMAPEHLRALVDRDPVLARKVDQRSDLYSLGMVLHEILTGHRPFEQSASYSPLPVVVEAMALERGRAVPSVRRLRPDVPWGLESIVRKCLAGDPEQRYQRAEHLAEDLRRFLDDRPLKHAPELSLLERGRKWMRRHPRLCSSGVVAAAAALLLLVGGLAFAATRSQLAASRAEDRKRSFEAGAVRALFLVNTTTELGDHLRQGQTVCEETLGLYGVLERPDWREQPDWLRLSEEDRRKVAEDARELLLLLAGARVRLASPSPYPLPQRGGEGRVRGCDPAVLREALGLLDRAEAIPDLPPCRALWEDRAAYRDQLGDGAEAAAARAKAEDIPPTSARDHYLLAMTYARERRHEEAIKHLDEALRLNPRHYWSWVQHGICQQERGEPALAAADFGACVGLWPDFAWGYFNRAAALAQCGRKAEAVADYTRALERDPALLPAYVNRGLARLELEQFGPALDDFDAARQRGGDDAALHAGRGVALERLGRPKEADSAFREAEERAAALPKEQRLRLRWVYGFAVALRLPQQARAAFDAVLTEEPANAQALYGRALLLDRARKDDEALGFYDRALEQGPGFQEARRYRAILRARHGDFAGAEADVNFLLEREPNNGPALYAGACVAALMAEQSEGATARRVAMQALDLLRKALARGYGKDKAADDPDLIGIRFHPEFRKILGASGVMETN
jgi:serine/threonine protein kinase/tetratricopeptide (TPR) repeat protein